MKKAIIALLPFLLGLLLAALFSYYVLGISPMPTVCALLGAFISWLILGAAGVFNYRDE